MMIRFVVCLVLAFALSRPALAQNLDDATAAKLQSALEIGKDINAHDQSAWHVTDELMALRPDAAGKRILYVTERVDPKRVKTSFLLIEGTKVSLFFEGVVEGSTVVSTRDFTGDLNPPAATSAQAARVDALLTARDMFPDGLCGQRPNCVVLPSHVDGALDVYALAPETATNMVQLGGHVRLTIDANGLVIPNETKAYSNSCLGMDIGKNAEALMISLPENIGDTPTEIHVFKSLSHGIPIYVSTKTGIWAVEGARIRLVDAKAAN